MRDPFFILIFKLINSELARFLAEVCIESVFKCGGTKRPIEIFVFSAMKRHIFLIRSERPASLVPRIKYKIHVQRSIIFHKHTPYVRWYVNSQYNTIETFFFTLDLLLLYTPRCQNSACLLCNRQKEHFSSIQKRNR